MVAQCDDRIRCALRHKVRVVKRHYSARDEVYYSWDSDRAEWRGTATMISNRGALYFLMHKGELVHTREAEEQMGSANSTHSKHSKSELSKEGEVLVPSPMNAQSAKGGTGARTSRACCDTRDKACCSTGDHGTASRGVEGTRGAGTAGAG